MKVILHAEKCELHGECILAAPEVFAIDDDAEVVTVLDENPPERLRKSVEEAAMVCPVAAIEIQD
ncbi:ferredoxin [Mycolicibacterium moriokaense]|nr:ferredoxin [Mycolicibacterium moriokaense]MCV7039181.1 ferredoxin [Mycolicibacterium moriokaense]ORB18589.1 ferredoxin [Mycolicibacterium moriokaense]